MTMLPPVILRNSPTPLLLPWGRLGEIVSRLVRLCPDIAPRFMLLPARGLHATAIALHVATASGETDNAIASRVLRTHPRDLLRSALPEAEPQLYRLLDKATTPAWPMATYRRLDAILKSRVASVIHGAGNLTPERIDSADLLLHADPIVWRARRAYRYDHERQHLATVVETLRSLGLLANLAELPDGCGHDAVRHRIRADLAAARGPDIAFPAIPGWSRVESVADLWAIGDRLKVCVRPGRWGAGEYAIGLISGQEMFLHHREFDLLAQLRHVLGPVWTVVQIGGSRNEPASPDVRAAVEEGVKAGGLRLVPTQPREAFDTFLQRKRNDRFSFDDIEDDGDDELAA